MREPYSIDGSLLLPAMKAMPDPSRSQVANDAVENVVSKRSTAPLAASTIASRADSPLRRATAIRSPFGDHAGEIKKPGASDSGSFTDSTVRGFVPSALVTR